MTRTQYVVVGVSAFTDTSVVVGTFQLVANALRASGEMDALGYVTEICPIQQVSDLGPVINDEGAER